MEFDEENYGPHDLYDWDWADDPEITIVEADKLNELDKLRRRTPIIWALVHGLQTSRSIAGWVCWPHYYVIWQLRKYKEEGLVYDNEGRRHVVWRFDTRSSDPEVKHWLALRKWIQAQQRDGGLFNPHENESSG